MRSAPPGAHECQLRGTVTDNAGDEFAIGTWTASLSGIAQYRSSINFQPGAGGQLGYDRDGHLFTANASGYISPPGEKLRIGVYANNLFNNDYAAFRQTAQPYGVYYNAAKPRTYGMRLEYIF